MQVRNVSFPIMDDLAFIPNLFYHSLLYAQVAELVDALDLGSSAARRGGSSPPP